MQYPERKRQPTLPTANTTQLGAGLRLGCFHLLPAWFFPSPQLVNPLQTQYSMPSGPWAAGPSWTAKGAPAFATRKNEMNCEEEQIPGLHEPAAKRPLSDTALQHSDFYQSSGLARDGGTPGPSNTHQLQLLGSGQQKGRQPVDIGQWCLLSTTDAVQQPYPFPSPSAWMIRCQFSLQTHQKRQAGCSAGYKQGASLVCLP